MAFVLVGILHRVIRLLRLDDPLPLEDHHDQAAMIERESQNRLVWACYFIDLFMGTAGERNSCWINTIPRIPLPAESDADHNNLAFTTTPRYYLEKDIDDVGLIERVEDFDLSGLVIIVVRLRMQGLQ